MVDAGPGIAPEERERAVRPFQRLGGRSNDAGVGLGLAVASGFVKAIGGKLELEESPGGGLTATINLPLDIALSAAAAAADGGRP